MKEVKVCSQSHLSVHWLPHFLALVQDCMADCQSGSTCPETLRVGGSSAARKGSNVVDCSVASRKTVVERLLAVPCRKRGCALAVYSVPPGPRRRLRPRAGRLVDPRDTPSPGRDPDAARCTKSCSVATSPRSRPPHPQTIPDSSPDSSSAGHRKRSLWNACWPGSRCEWPFVSFRFPGDNSGLRVVNNAHSQVWMTAPNHPGRQSCLPAKIIVNCSHSGGDHVVHLPVFILAETGHVEKRIKSGWSHICWYSAPSSP